MTATDPIAAAAKLILPEPSETEAAEGLPERGSKKRDVCFVSGQTLSRKDLVPVATLRPSLIETLRRDYPDLPDNAKISRKELNRLRGEYVEQLLRNERGEISSLEREVIESLERHETLAEDTDKEFEEHRTLGERMADGVASFGGSWLFISSFFFFLAVWMAINLAMGDRSAFDAYPFILLNLVLSCLAAIQAPIIMMSQKRQEAKDRARSQNDYAVNLKAELEIRHLHEKIDHLLNRQWERLTEIQSIQLEQLQDIATTRGRRPKKIVKAKPAKDKAPKVKAKAPPADPTGDAE
jgi:uncharacterized membrane protein